MNASTQPATIGHAAQPPVTHESRLLPAGCVLLAFAWLTSRVIVGLDFTDEMQYYGEIASLLRTGKFFQTDLFLQQLGYLFPLPFFKLHALLFPDLSYLVLFGRLLLLASYIVVGLLLWRTTAKQGLFSVSQRLVALAAFLAWVPFQLFALSYNSMAYLLIVALLALRFARRGEPSRSSTFATAVGLVMLTVSYPPTGIVLAVMAVADAWQRNGPRPALMLLALTFAGGMAVLVALLALNGPSFISDIRLALAFSRGFAGGAILQADAFASWAILMLAIALFVWRSCRATAFQLPSWLHPTAGRSWLLLITFFLAVLWLLTQSVQWTTGYVPAAVLLLLNIAVGGAIDARAPRIVVLALLASAAAILIVSARWATGHFIASAYMTLLAMLAAFARQEDRRVVAQLATIGAALGTIVAFSSGNGLHNFGVGAAGVIPFLVLYVARGFSAAPALPLPKGVSAWCAPAAVVLIVTNGALYPYREQAAGQRFERVQGVPAFAGVWTAPAKIEMIEAFRRLLAENEASGKRLLVAGPHPWIYLISGTQPTTPMLFMHFTVSERNYDSVAHLLFRAGEPEIIVVPNAVPRAIQERIATWAAKGCVVQTLTLTGDLRQRYTALTRQEIGDRVLLLRRASPAP